MDCKGSLGGVKPQKVNCTKRQNPYILGRYGKNSGIHGPGKSN